MLKHLFKGVLSVIAITLLTHYRHLSIRLLKIEAATAYLHGLQLVRQSAIGLIRIGLVIALIGIGVLLLHAGLFILLPWSLQAKAILGLCLGTAYVIAGTVALCTTMNQKRWMEKSGASKMLKEITEQPRTV
jgi:hypothetical protein